MYILSVFKKKKKIECQYVNLAEFVNDFLYLARYLSWKGLVMILHFWEGIFESYFLAGTCYLSNFSLHIFKFC